MIADRIRGGKPIVLVLGTMIFASCTSVQRVLRVPFSQCSMLKSFSTAGIYESTQVAFTSDGLTIGAFLTKPRGTGPFPAYVHNHGAMTREQAAASLWQAPGEIDSRIAAAGYLVLRPARRGYLRSEGTTTTYWVQGSRLRVSDVISGAYNEARDVQSAVGYLRGCPFVDPQRIVIGGHSLGGLVAVITAAKHPDLAGIVSINGGITWTQNGIEQGFPAVSAVWRAEAAHLSTPVLLLHGRDDAVVTPELSRELAGLLQDRAAPVTLKIYPGDHYTIPIGEILKFLDATVKAR
jgi:dipeptidyl aminopeptidase/acylaminoacyl peptidase